MEALKVSEDKSYFTRHGEPFFYLADTAWAAFSCMTDKEWEEYLDFRKSQNFNAVQVSVLPILHDCSEQRLVEQPFLSGPDGKWNPSQINRSYFERAARMVGKAAEKGFTVCLTLLWGSYVRGNWMSDLPTSILLPQDAIEPYVTYVSELFRPYRPLYFASGDVGLDDPETVRCYQAVLNCLKLHDPESLVSMHLCGGYHRVPNCLAEKMDFYTYQSGHDIGKKRNAYQLAREFGSKPIQLPVFNAEPCYEGHGTISQPGRHGRQDVRYAFWNSVLGGAKAGFCYGAHGVWSCHRSGGAFVHESWSKLPYDFHESLRLEGAWDVGFSKWVFESYGLFRLNRFETAADNEDVPLATGPSLFAAYLPYATHIVPGFSLDGYDVIGIALDQRRIFCPRHDATEIEMPQQSGDFLMVGLKK